MSTGRCQKRGLLSWAKHSNQPFFSMCRNETPNIKNLPGQAANSGRIMCFSCLGFQSYDCRRATGTSPSRQIDIVGDSPPSETVLSSFFISVVIFSTSASDFLPVTKHCQAIFALEFVPEYFYEIKLLRLCYRALIVITVFIADQAHMAVFDRF